MNLNAMLDERFLVFQMHELLSYLNQLGVVTIESSGPTWTYGADAVAGRHELPQRQRNYVTIF